LPYKSPKNTCNFSDINDTLCLTGIADTTIEYAKSMLQKPSDPKMSKEEQQYKTVIDQVRTERGL
jgi:hypothetical protein